MLLFIDCVSKMSHNFSLHRSTNPRDGAESRGAEINCLPEPEPKLRIAVPAPFYLLQT